ncbi:MAG: alpha-isopropylmalate synthase regulatory domain-containing protein, partial [Candidatus Nanoarchaeia archaeon]
PVSAAVHALKSIKDMPEFILEDFSEQALGITADATAVAYVGLKFTNSIKVFYGAGEHSNIEHAAILAIFSALNRAAAGI